MWRLIPSSVDGVELEGSLPMKPQNRIKQLNKVEKMMGSRCCLMRCPQLPLKKRLAEIYATKLPTGSFSLSTRKRYSDPGQASKDGSVNLLVDGTVCSKANAGSGMN